MRHLKDSLLVVLSVGVLSACSGNVKETLGLKKQAPDEFRVVSNQPLSVPPDFRLIEPTPGAKRPHVSALDKQAEAVLFGSEEEQVSTLNREQILTSSLTSRGESALLSRAGVSEADPNIRDILTEEERVQVVEEEEKGFFSKVIDYTRGVGDDEAPELDAVAEKKRISEAQKAGEEVTGDDTAIHEKKDTGLLGRLFD